MENVFAKPKVNILPANDKGMVKIVIQDETYTIMEPLLDILQHDQRLLFAGYKNKHCLDNEMTFELKCVLGNSERQCFQEALGTLLTRLTDIERNYTSDVLHA